MQIVMQSKLLKYPNISPLDGSHKYYAFSIRHTGLEVMSELQMFVMLKFLSQLSRSLESNEDNPAGLFKSDPLKAAAVEASIHDSLLPIFKGDTDEERILEMARIYSYYYRRHQREFVDAMPDYKKDVLKNLDSLIRPISSGDDLEKLKKKLTSASSENGLGNIYIAERGVWTLVNSFAVESKDFVFSSARNPEDNETLKKVLTGLIETSARENEYFAERVSMKKDSLESIALDKELSEIERIEALRLLRRTDVADKIRDMERTISETMDTKTFEEIIDRIERGEWLNIERIRTMHDEFRAKITRDNREAIVMMDNPERAIEELREDNDRLRKLLSKDKPEVEEILLEEK